jgi:hypothetical protein
MGEAEGLGDPCAIIATPFGNGTLAARATQHRTTRQREDGGERMAFPTRFPKVGRIFPPPLSYICFQVNYLSCFRGYDVGM